MVALTEMGAIIAPPIPGFYHQPQSVLELVDHSVDRVLDLLGLPAQDARRWDPAPDPSQGFEMKKPALRAAFQGEPGAFSQEALEKLLGKRAEAVPCQRFEDVFLMLKEKRVSGAVIPIENTLAGSVHENYDHLLHFDFQICGETNVRIITTSSPRPACASGTCARSTPTPSRSTSA